MDITRTAAPTPAPTSPPPAPPAPPPRPPSPAEAADKKAQELIDAHQQDDCVVSLPGVGGIGCEKDTDGVAVGRDIADIAKTNPAEARLVYDKAQAKTPDADERREVARGLAEGLSHDEMRQLADSANGRTMLEGARTELKADAGNEANQAAITRIDSALKAADLKKSPEFKALDPATQQRTLDQIGRQQADAAAVDNTVALVKSAGFQAASPATRGELLAAQERHGGDTIFREGLERLAADPAFKALSPGQQADAVRAFGDFAKSETYQGKEGSWFFNWGARSVSDGDKRAMLDNLRRVVTSTGFHDVMPEARTAMLDAFRPHATDSAFTGRLAALVDSAGFIGLNDVAKEKQLLGLYGQDDAFARGVDALTADAAYAALGNPQQARLLGDVARLGGTEGFQDLSAAEKTAVLSQVRNYPDPKVVSNLERLVGKDWFQDYDTGDMQRALKLIAYMSYPRTGVDQAIIDNTLEKFLGDKAPYELELESISAKPGNITFGHASGDTMTINEDLVAANNDKLETDTHGRKLSLDTIPHEINHLINDDKVAETFDYLNEEYRAWYVGESAINGRPPTNEEALERWAYFLDPGSGYYDSAAKGALADSGEAAKIFDQLSQLTGLTVDASNYRQVLSDLAADPTKFKTQPGDPAVVPPGNLDNH